MVLVFYCLLYRKMRSLVKFFNVERKIILSTRGHVIYLSAQQL